jgi:hypothetical protein
MKGDDDTKLDEANDNEYSTDSATDGGESDSRD